jgi:hypothetical protein
MDLDKSSRWLEKTDVFMRTRGLRPLRHTALALKSELGLHFTGPVKTAHKYFHAMDFESNEKGGSCDLQMQ